VENFNTGPPVFYLFPRGLFILHWWEKKPWLMKRWKIPLAYEKMQSTEVGFDL